MLLKGAGNGEQCLTAEDTDRHGLAWLNPYPTMVDLFCSHTGIFFILTYLAIGKIIPVFNDFEKEGVYCN